MDLSSRVVCIVLKGLGENLRKIAMHVTNEFVTSAVNTNYDYYICYVALDNFNLSHLPVYIMGEDKVSRYSLYSALWGPLSDLLKQLSALVEL